MKLCIIGVGYVGLVTAAVFADFRNFVWGVDVDKQKIKKLKKGEVPFFEPKLKELISKNLKNKRLIFSSNIGAAIKQAEIIFICVGTPAKENGDYDLRYVFEAAKTIGKNIKKYALVCIKSTVPPSTTEELRKIISKYCAAPFEMASCPEFLREGSAIDDSLHPARIVLGVESKKGKEMLLKLHQQIKAKKYIFNIKSAQLVKYAANAYLATKISFINSIASLCEKIGADIEQVTQGLGSDPRIGDQFLQAGLGYGGSCFPKDTWALISFAQRIGYDFKFLKEVDRVNQQQIDKFIEKILQICKGSVRNKTITILGLAFKPNTDDMREARSTLIIKKLQKLGAKINAYDPKAVVNAKKILKNVSYFNELMPALNKSCLLVLVTEWPEFRKIDFNKVKKIMKEKKVIDGRNFLDSKKLKALGFQYQGIGRN